MRPISSKRRCRGRAPGTACEWEALPIETRRRATWRTFAGKHSSTLSWRRQRRVRNEDDDGAAGGKALGPRADLGPYRAVRGKAAPHQAGSQTVLAVPREEGRDDSRADWHAPLRGR